MRVIAVGLTLSLAASVASAAPILPCGVADPGGRTGFVSNAHGGIDAVDLATGELLWEVSGARRPALADDDRLFAWTPVNSNSLRVAAFRRTGSGRRLLESEPVTFPDWVHVEEAPGSSFKARWRLEKGRLILNWEARAWYSGPHATPEMDAQARKFADGQARIDLETGKVEQGPADPRPAPPRLPKELEKAAFRWQGPVGDRHAALVQEERDGQQHLSLWSWDADKTEGPKELFAGAHLRTMLSIDEGFLWLREASPSPDQEPGSSDRKKLDWSIFSVDRGELVASIPYEAGTEGAAIVGPRAYCIVAGPLKGPIDKPFVRSRSLRAFDLKAGKPLWEHAVEGKNCLPPAP